MAEPANTNESTSKENLDTTTTAPTGPKKTLTFIGFFSITAAMVMSVHQYTTFAVAGMQIPFFLLASGILWFLPVALCSAEIATVKGWPDGGIFTWVSKMLGIRFGFAALLFQWFQITVCFITLIYFMISILSYALAWPALDNNPVIKLIATLILFWVISLSQFAGIKRTVKLAKYGFLLGVVAALVVLVILAIVYLAMGHPLQFTWDNSNLLPDFTSITVMVVFVSFLFANMGAEASATHINEMVNPKRDYPLAMILLVILATFLNAVGGFTVLGVVPINELSMSGGIAQTYEALVVAIFPGLKWVVRIICVFLFFGVLGEVASWVVGPSRGIYMAVEQGLLPQGLKEENKNGVPTRIIILQGVIVSIWAILLTLIAGGSNASFLAALTLTAVIYLSAYMLMFASYFKLAHHPEMDRYYNVPGGRVGKYFFAIAGFFSSLFALIVAFFPPVVLKSSEVFSYELILAIGFLVMLSVPFIIFQTYSKKHMKAPDSTSDTTSATTTRHKYAADVNRYVQLGGRGEHMLDAEERKDSH